jgi:hypothetical protein
MNKVLSVFLDRLSERMTALVAGLVSARVAGMHAEVQAQQQSDLEDLARRYDADGKSEIAESLRRRSLRITSSDLAGEGTEIVNLTMVPLQDPGNPEPTDLRALPDFSGSVKRKPRNQARREETAAEEEENS